MVESGSGWGSSQADTGPWAQPGAAGSEGTGPTYGQNAPGTSFAPGPGPSEVPMSNQPRGSSGWPQASSHVALRTPMPPDAPKPPSRTRLAILLTVLVVVVIGAAAIGPVLNTLERRHAHNEKVNRAAVEKILRSGFGSDPLVSPDTEFSASDGTRTVTWWMQPLPEIWGPRTLNNIRSPATGTWWYQTNQRGIRIEYVLLQNLDHLGSDGDTIAAEAVKYLTSELPTPLERIPSAHEGIAEGSFEDHFVGNEDARAAVILGHTYAWSGTVFIVQASYPPSSPEIRPEAEELLATSIADVVLVAD